MTPRSLGLPTDISHVAGGPVDLPSPHPLGINYRPVNLLGLRLPTHAQAASRWIRVSTVVKWSSVVGPAVYCTSRQREIQCSIPRNFFESRVSRVSLTSLFLSQLMRGLIIRLGVYRYMLLWWNCSVYDHRSVACSVVVLFSACVFVTDCLSVNLMTHEPLGISSPNFHGIIVRVKRRAMCKNRYICR